MTDEEIEALCEACAEGPWTLEGGADGLFLLIAKGDQRHARGDVLCMGHWSTEARLLAAARTLIPELLARAKAAEEERDEARGELALLVRETGGG